MSEKIKNREKFKLSTCVFVFLVDGDNILLLLRDNTGWLDGYYSVPGGMKEKREIAKWAAKRELEEEIGVEVEPTDLHLVHVMHCFTTGEEWYGLYYLATKWDGDPIVKEPHKHKELKWVPIAELPKNMSPYVLQAVSKFKDRISESDFGWEVGEDATEEDYVSYYTDKV